MNFIEFNTGRFDTRSAEARALRAARAPLAGKRLHLVQFAGPIKPEWRAELEQLGVRIVTHIPQNTYLVYGDQAALARLQTWAGAAPHVQWDGPLQDTQKIHPNARGTDAKGRARDVGTDTFSIQLVGDDDANSKTLDFIRRTPLAHLKQDYAFAGYRNLIVQLPAHRLGAIAAQPDVISIQPYFTPRKLDERQAQIMAGNLTSNAPSGPGYLAWLATNGFTQAQFDTSGFVVDLTDTGVDNGTTSPGHFALYRLGDPGDLSRIVYNRLEGTSNMSSTISGCDGHGNLNAHILGGYVGLPADEPHADNCDFLYDLGICPFVKLGSSVIFDPAYTYPNFSDLQSRAYSDGARISANSWGTPGAGIYNADSQVFDALVRDAQPAGAAFATNGNQPMIIVVAAGNNGPGAVSINAPGTAKNVITVGASENVRPIGGTDEAGVSDVGADDATDIISFSSRGPCADGRYKPDLVAPGTHITGGVAQDGSPTTNGTGSALPCYDGSGVKGGPGGTNFFPAGQEFYTASSGTSHAVPAVAGACALLRQDFINNNLTPPSPALTKAFLVNSTRYMTGNAAGDTLPSHSQGMGAVHLGTAFDNATRILRDQRAEDKFTAAGQARTYAGTVTDTNQPFRVTLAWTDAPGSTVGAAYNNNLDLTVTIAGKTYKGNVFTGANSTTNGFADVINNVESVFLPAGVTGPFTVTVTAADINSDGVPNEAPALDQDFALVIYNAAPAEGSLVVGAGYTIAAENCYPGNGAVDPDETVTLNFYFQNAGTSEITNLVATLLPSDGVTNPSSPQLYGTLATNGSAIGMPFTFIARGVCGSNIQATFALTNGVTNFPNVTFTIPLGAQETVWAENFDGVTEPELPVGWSTSAGGAQAAWVTSSLYYDTPPNAMYSTAASSTGSNELVSATISLPLGPSQLRFKHRYQFEPSFDGGVLEMKIGAGAFDDILALGGGFAIGGYSMMLNATNPFGARLAWSGTNQTFSSVVVNLPAAAAGQAVQFRWRSATDDLQGASGWYVDSVTIRGPECCPEVIAPVIIEEPQGSTNFLGAPVELTVHALGRSPLNYQWYFNSNALSGETFTNLAIAGMHATNAGSYFVIVTNNWGAATSSVATLSFFVPPEITTNPASQTVLLGDPVEFVVAATGEEPLSYQWQLDGTDIFGATSSNYYLASTTGWDAGDYTVTVTNIAGVVTSSVATLSFFAPPNITTNPESQTVLVGEPVLFSVSATGEEPLSYQWQFNDEDIPGATTNTYFITNAALSNAGSYTVIITNIAGAATSSPAFLTVNLPPDPPTLSSPVFYDGQFEFLVEGTTGTNYVVLMSTNLAETNWISIITNPAPFYFTDTNAMESPFRFYRGRLAP